MARVVAGVVLALALWVAGLAASRGPADREVAVGLHGEPVVATDSLRLLTLNVAHGRAERSSQYLVTAEEHRAYLNAIAAVIAREAPHVVALQEVEGASWNTGRFDHLRYLAEGAGLARSVFGAHVDLAVPAMSYGASLLLNVEASEARTHAFALSPPTPPKGFVVSAVELDDRPVDVVSAHLNMGWDARALQWLVAELQLSAWEPDAALVTFPPHGTRIDWVLVSPELELVDQLVLPDAVSDHRAVRASVRWR